MLIAAPTGARLLNGEAVSKIREWRNTQREQKIPARHPYLLAKDPKSQSKNGQIRWHEAEEEILIRLLTIEHTTGPGQQIPLVL